MDNSATTQPGICTRTRAGAALLLVAVVTGCTESPVAPRRVIPAQQAQPSPPIRVDGLVVDGVGTPVPGATVAALSSESNAAIASTSSNHQGAYTLSFQTPATLQQMTAEGDGFEPSRHYVDLSAESEGVVRRDLRLHRIQHLRAGDAVSLTLAPDDPACFDFVDEWWCRTIRVVHPGGNYVRAWVTDPRAAIKQAGSRGSATPRVDVLITGSEEVILEVMAREVPRTVTLHTSHD